MEQQINLLAQLTVVDGQLDELHYELGDLPQVVKKLEAIMREKLAVAEVTQKLLHDLDHMRGTAHVTSLESVDRQQMISQ